MTSKFSQSKQLIIYSLPSWCLFVPLIINPIYCSALEVTLVLPDEGKQECETSEALPRVQTLKLWDCSMRNCPTWNLYCSWLLALHDNVEWITWFMSVYKVQSIWSRKAKTRKHFSNWMHRLCSALRLQQCFIYLNEVELLNLLMAEWQVKTQYHSIVNTEEDISQSHSTRSIVWCS